MNVTKIEKVFWIILILWTILRGLLLGCQLYGNKSVELKKSVLKYFSQSDIDKGKTYALTGFWFKTIYGFFFTYLLVFLLTKGYFNKLWNFTNKLFENNSFICNLVYIILFLGIIRLASLPFSYYFGFLREKSMGFSNMNFGSWLWFYIKGSGISVLLQSTGILIIIYCIKIFPNAWPGLLTIVMTLFSLAITILYPIFITPMFYEETPLGAGPLKNKIMAIAKKAQVEISKISVINESKYSNHTNAYFTGFGKRKKIVLYDTLIKSHTPDEAALIFAHESGHWKHNHVFIGLSLGSIAILLMSLAVWVTFPYLSKVEMFHIKNLASAGSLPFFFIIAMIFQLFTAPIESQISQAMERQADWSSLEYTNLTKTFIDAEKRLAKDNKSDLLPNYFRVFWLYSHPPTIDRINMAKSYEKLNN